VPPQIASPVGLALYPPAPERSAWDKKETALKKPGVAQKQRPPQPAPHPPDPTQPDLALRLWAQCQAPHPAVRGPWITADALSGTAPGVDGASVRCGGVPVISQRRRKQTGRGQKRAPPVAEYLAPHPGTPQTLRIRGGQEVGAIVGSARLSVCSHHPKRFVVALQYPDADP
jgi:hypothetical protein